MGGRKAGRAVGRLGVAVAALAAAFGQAGTAFADFESDSVTPGVLAAQKVTGDQYGQCTLAFLVQSPDGPAAFTAGHCQSNDRPLVTHRGNSYPEFGSFVHSVGDGTAMGQPDVGLIEISDKGSGLDARVTGQWPVRGVLTADQLDSQKPELCKYGQATGLTCGAFERVQGQQVIFAAHSAAGDSGGPVFAKNSDGSVTAVGVISGSLPGGEDGGRATLIAPWLGKWNLTLL